MEQSSARNAAAGSRAEMGGHGRPRLAQPDASPGVRIAAVRPRTPAARAGLAAGDRIVAINGESVADAIDFQFHAAEDQLAIHVDGERGRHAVTLQRGGAPDLGIELEPPRPGEIATCANKCVFCFIHQLPRGLRKSLYVKDDDYRLSFLHGNYITLSDLSEAALERIERQRLSPLYVSVHATDPELRHALLGRPRHDAAILPRLVRLARAGIRMHAQIVLCPGWNDGAHLERTVFELAPLHPHVVTTAIVPVGLTRHRERLPALRPLGVDEAQALIATVDGWQDDFRRRLGGRFVFLADEIYLLAGYPLPPARAYEGFPIVEDGIGLVRRFEDGFARALARRRRTAMARRTVVSGEMFASRLATLIARIPGAESRVRVVAVPNEFFGRGIGVAGLLTGGDIQRQVAALADPGETVLVPAVAVRERDGVFLDDLTPADLTRDLGMPVRVIEPTPAALLAALRAA